MQMPLRRYDQWWLRRCPHAIGKSRVALNVHFFSSACCMCGCRESKSGSCFSCAVLHPQDHMYVMNLRNLGWVVQKRGRADNSDTKLMVRNLAFEATSKDVRQLMESFGQVKSCRLPKKFDGSTRGFAFVEFATKGDALKAINSANGAHLYGRRLLLEYAKGDEGVEELRSKMAKGRLDVQ